jgi:hypothetical protein
MRDADCRRACARARGAGAPVSSATRWRGGAAVCATAEGDMASGGAEEGGECGRLHRNVQIGELRQRTDDVAKSASQRA